MSEPEKPQFKHHCDRCEFLGVFHHDGRPYYDLYFCSKKGYPQVGIRYSDHPDRCDFQAAHGAFAEAERIAKERGLLVMPTEAAR